MEITVNADHYVNGAPEAVSPPPAPPTATVQILIVPDRLNKLKAGTYRQVGSSPQAQVEFIAHFMAGGDGVYLPADEAIAWIDENYTVEDLSAAIDSITKKMNEVAVGKK